MYILETERLLLREFVADDAENHYLLNLDDEVIRYTGDVSFQSVQHARSFLEKYDHYKKYGFGRWAVITKRDQEFIGWCGLKYIPVKGEHDIGYRFFKKYWGKGYATESAKSCLDLGFSRFGLNKIVGRVMSANIPSIKVLEKIGLRFESDFDFDGQDGKLYSISKNT